jgi:O-antigen/teichoic acid export membrane protein
MDILFRLVACFAALLLIAAAFVYPFNPEVAQKLLKRLLLSLLGLLAGLGLVGQLAHQLGGICAGILFMLASGAAYWVREYRRRPPGSPEKPSRAERKPILPNGR